MSGPTYTKRVFGIRQTIERTLDDVDAEIFGPGVRLVQDDGTIIQTATAADLNAVGATRIIASRDIRTHHWNIEEGGFPITLLDAPDGTTWTAP